jgi:hypothetical protein
MSERTILNFGSIEEMNDASALLQESSCQVNAQDHDSDEAREDTLAAGLAQIMTLTPEEKRERAQALDDDYYATRPGLQPEPMTQLEQDLRDGKLGKLYTPKQYRRLEFRRRIVRPLVRVVRPREARPSRRRRVATSAHGPPGRLDDPDDPAPAIGRLRAIISRILGGRS